MKQLNHITLCLFLCLLGGLQLTTAQVTYDTQNTPTAQEKVMDESIRACTEGELGANFELSEWTAQLHYHTRKMIQRLSSEYVSAIAAQKPKVIFLHQILAECPELAEIKAEIEGIHKIFDKKIIYQKESTSAGLFDDEEIQAKMDKGDAEDLLKKLEKIQKKLNITRYIIRIQ